MLRCACACTCALASLLRTCDGVCHWHLSRDIARWPAQQQGCCTPSGARCIALERAACRVRQLGHKAVAKQVASNVVSRDELEGEIADMGARAQAEGFTTAQVLEPPLTAQWVLFACRPILQARTSVS